MSAPAPPPKCDPAAQDRRAGGIWLPPGTLRAVLLMLLAVVAFAAMNATIRYLSARLHPFEIAFFRNAFMVACLLPVVLRQGWRLLATDRFPLHLMRGAVNTVSMLSFFMAMSLLPLADASALTFTGPLFAAVMAVAL
ncbi:MAG: DMT family transporter, partial [Alphaproteobacteria bacterium]|nr:DMT family transporter [Alphaproteobacteria bacterium]